MANSGGLKCENPRKIYQRLNKFINSSEFDECLKNVLNTEYDNGTEFIVNYLKDNK